MALSRLLSTSCYEVSEGILGKLGALTFTLTFETAQFKKHHIKLYRDTYVAPPPSAVAGMVGAILGVGRRELKRFACREGLLTGAAALSFEGKIDESMTVVKMKEWRMYIRAPKRSVLLYRPTFKLAVASPNGSLIDELEDRLRRLDFEYEVFGGNDYNFLAEVGPPERARVRVAKEGVGYCRVEDLEGVSGRGSVYSDYLSEEGLKRYAFGYGVTLRLRRGVPAADDGEHAVLIHEAWKFLR